MSTSGARSRTPQASIGLDDQYTTMTRSTTHDLERSTARCRIILSIVALLAIFVGQATPRWVGLKHGGGQIDPLTLTVLASHLSYSIFIYEALARRWSSVSRLTSCTIWCDVLFGAAIAFCTEGAISPFYAFFAFAVVAAGFRAGFRRSMQVTAVSVVLYLSLLLVTSRGDISFYLMRPVYLAIVGYLVGYFGQERLKLEAELKQAEAAKERSRIARELHDGYVQTLAGVNLRLASCRELLRRGRAGTALAELAQLQASVNNEHDNFRSYMRSLAGLESSPRSGEADADTQFCINILFSGSGMLVDQVLQIIRESVTNVRHHARAHWASLRARTEGAEVVITVDDDGVGFGGQAEPSWSIASRVRDLNGLMRVSNESEPGGHVAIALPRR